MDTDESSVSEQIVKQDTEHAMEKQKKLYTTGNDIRQKILNYVHIFPGCYADDVAKALHLPCKRVLDVVNELLDSGELFFDEEDKRSV